MAELKLAAEMREGVGKNKVDKLRRDKIVPGVIYSRGDENKVIQVTEKDLSKIYLEAGTSTIIDLVIDEKEYPVLIKSAQRHPFKNIYMSVDFYGIKMDERIRVQVPIILLGRDEIRVQPSVLNHLMNDLEVECLPAYIPQAAEVSVVDMQYNDVLTVADLNIFGDENITILAEETDAVCSLSEPREEVIEEDVEVDAGDVPTVGEEEESSEE